MQNEKWCETDTYFMRQAIRLAQCAAAQDEVPVGALIVQGDKIVGAAYNTREHSRCATHHAEILAIEQACRALGGWRLPGVTLYVTMEPCLMCAGAIANARIERVVFGTRDVRFGAYGSLTDVNALPLNHRTQVCAGVLQEDCRALLQSYFRQKRSQSAERKQCAAAAQSQNQQPQEEPTV